MLVESAWTAPTAVLRRALHDFYRAPTALSDASRALAMLTASLWHDLSPRCVRARALPVMMRAAANNEKMVNGGSAIEARRLGH